jgi:hypothetical protein
MERQRWGWTHRYAVPMFVASLVAVVLAGGGLIAVTVLDDDDANPDSGIDSCLLGSWRMMSHTEELSSLGQTIQLTLTGEGALYEFREDGTGSADYGTGTTFTSTSLGQEVLATVAGTLSFRYEASDGIFQVVEMLSTEATFTVDLLGTEVPSSYQLSTTAPEDYVCEGDTLSFSLEERSYAAEYRRAPDLGR